ncbi:MAG: succinate dehydrogenase, hydrophobic membrane anchor protein [Geminicoccaceae bacterium]
MTNATRQVAGVVSSPYHATAMVLLAISGFWHAKLGVQVVIEDCVHCEALKIAALTAVTLVSFALAVASIVSVLSCLPLEVLEA